MSWQNPTCRLAPAPDHFERSDQRRDPGATRLCGVPVMQLRAFGAEFEKYVHPWMEALRAYWRQRPHPGEKLGAALDGTDPQGLKFVDRELMLKIPRPPLNVFHRFLTQDDEEDEEFNKALLLAVHLHHEYRTADEERADDVDGAIALAPPALACLAHGAGRSVTIESDHLPAHLLARRSED
ncbi:immunity 49 family protein [Streptomyces sp. NPDC007172]|uniref:immunity 49 family protein n=1 Tax=Streptomyces sp. NPDC007172 TaxID=3364776 RepID=UPI0036B6765F